MTSRSVSRAQVQVAFTAFAALFSIVGIALYGLPFFYDFMVTEFGWTRAQVTSGNAYSKLLVGPLFGFFAGSLASRALTCLVRPACLPASSSCSV